MPKRKLPAANARVCQIRADIGLSRRELVEITKYSRTFVDNWLNDPASPNFREAPAAAVRLLELETGFAKPTFLGRRIKAAQKA